MESEWLSEAESVFDRISRAQEEAVDGFSVDLSLVGDGPAGGEALLAPGNIRLDQDRFGRLLAKTLTIIQDWIGGTDIVGEGGDGEGCRLSQAERESLLAAAIEGGGALEKRSADFAARPEAFACAARYAFAPFLRAYARGLRERSEAGSDPEPHLAERRFEELEGATRGRCPVCGAEPSMAEFDADDGRRRLACGLCGTRWRFPRLECPFCGNSDQKRLGFLQVEAEPGGGGRLAAGCRVDVCEACKRYVKTLDRRSLERPITLELADVLTPELDEAAAERGYGLRAGDARD